MLFIFVTAGNSTPISKRFPYSVAPSFSKNVSNSSSESNKKVNERIVSINHSISSVLTYRIHSLRGCLYEKWDGMIH